MAVEKRRHFTGVLYVPPDLPNRGRSPKNRADKRLHEKSLRGYLRGDRGFYYKGNYFPVLEIWQ
jgi:hypothetical protein